MSKTKSLLSLTDILIGFIPSTAICTTWKVPYLEFFWSVFSHIWTEYGEIRSISQYSFQMRENTNQENSEYGHFSCSYLCNDMTFLLVLNIFINKFDKVIKLYNFISSGLVNGSNVFCGLGYIDDLQNNARYFFDVT